MIIYTLWHAGDDSDAPWLVDAVDEYTVDNLNEFPETYQKARALVENRELMIDVPEKTVRALFKSPSVTAKVVKP